MDRLVEETDINVTGGSRARDRSKLAAADPRLRPVGHWDLHCHSDLRKYYWLFLMLVTQPIAGITSCQMR